MEPERGTVRCVTPLMACGTHLASPLVEPIAGVGEAGGGVTLPLGAPEPPRGQRSPRARGRRASGTPGRSRSPKDGAALTRGPDGGIMHGGRRLREGGLLTMRPGMRTGVLGLVALFGGKGRGIGGILPHRGGTGPDGARGPRQKGGRSARRGGATRCPRPPKPAGSKTVRHPGVLATIGRVGRPPLPLRPVLHLSPPRACPQGPRSAVGGGRAPSARRQTLSRGRFTPGTGVGRSAICATLGRNGGTGRR